MFKVLRNPKNEQYISLKNTILSDEFPWYFLKNHSGDLNHQNYVNISMFAHLLLGRSEYEGNGYSRSYSDLSKEASQVIKEIFLENNINLITFLRMNVNLVYPHPTIVNTVPHTDHNYKHKNLLIYLTNAGGKTIVEGEEYDPQEDDVVVFQGGKHYFQTPMFERRVVLVATFIDEEMIN